MFSRILRSLGGSHFLRDTVSLEAARVQVLQLIPVKYAPRAARTAAMQSLGRSKCKDQRHRPYSSSSASAAEQANEDPNVTSSEDEKYTCTTLVTYGKVH